MFWFDKNNPNVGFCDIREYDDVLCDGRELHIHPDIQCDFTNLPFQDKSYKLVVFDPPHLKTVGAFSWMAKKYGSLPSDWKCVLKAGFCECMRVLDDYGVLIFKWNETQISVKEIIECVVVQPLFGHRSGKTARTHLMCFMKMPEEEK